MCSLCPAGKYSSTVGGNSSGVCEDCWAGTFSSTVGGNSSDVCEDCRAGTFSSTVGGNSSDVCEDCGAGKYSSTVGATAVMCVKIVRQEPLLVLVATSAPHAQQEGIVTIPML